VSGNKNLIDLLKPSILVWSPSYLPEIDLTYIF
jgi:hypothetical protein